MFRHTKLKFIFNENLNVSKIISIFDHKYSNFKKIILIKRDFESC